MSEPTTVLTDYLLAALAFGLARRLSCPGFSPPLSRRLWAASFFVLAVAALVGGTWHGIPPDVLPSLRHYLWSITYVGIGLADLLILAGATRAALPLSGLRVAALVLLTGRFLVYTALILAERDFRLVGYDYAGTLLLLVAFGLQLTRRSERAGGFVLVGVLVSFAGGLIQALHLGLHSQFNHNDLFHVIQMAGIWVLSRAGLLLRDR